MLGIKVNNIFLDIPSSVVMELQRNNPFIGTDEIAPEYSLPISINYTEKNYKALGFTGNWYKQNKKYSVDAELYDGENFRYNGKLVIINHSGSITNAPSLIWNATFYVNSSSFLQTVSNVLLRDIDLGGDQSYPWTTYVHDDESGGFWQHIHDAREPNKFPYTFYPIKNSKWRAAEDGWNADYAGWMNRLNDDGNFQFDDDGFLSRPNIYNIVPMIYVRHILERIAAHNGWTLAGELLNDDGFNKLTQVGVSAIEWIKRRLDYVLVPSPTKFYEYTEKTTVVFNLQDFVPQLITIEQYLLNLRNRFGWKITFDTKTKTLNLNTLKSTVAGKSKNWTKYVQNPYTSDYKEVSNTYSLINNIDSDDTFPLGANINSISNLLDSVADSSSLPDPSTTDDGAVCYAFKENTYYINEYSDTINAYQWNILSHNIGNYEISQAKYTYTSEFSTMPTIPQLIRTDVYGLIPTCEKQGNHPTFTDYTDWGVRLLFYHGMVNDGEDQPYPYASCHSSDYAGNSDLTPWSIPYKREHDGINNGVHDYFFKEFLTYIQSDDIRTIRFNLPVFELVNFDWNDRLRIYDTEYVAESYKDIIPYNGVVEFKLKRVY
jgi:hypothetical protein